MFIGHFGVGLAAKRIDKKPSLGTLFFASQFIDLLWPFMIIFLATSLFFLVHIVSYPDWFALIGPHGNVKKYYIFFAILFGSSFRIRQLIQQVKRKEQNIIK